MTLGQANERLRASMQANAAKARFMADAKRRKLERVRTLQARVAAYPDDIHARVALRLCGGETLASAMLSDGAPGGGKSDLMRQVAAHMELPLIDLK